MFQIDLKNRMPIYEQIVDNYKRLIVSGALRADEKIPSVRDMSKILTCNPNTIQKAYRELEAQGYFYTVSGQGNFVSIPSDEEKRSADIVRKKEILFKKLLEIIAELEFLGETKESITDKIAGVGAATCRPPNHSAIRKIDIEKGSDSND